MSRRWIFIDEASLTAVWVVFVLVKKKREEFPHNLCNIKPKTKIKS